MLIDDLQIPSSGWSNFDHLEFTFVVSDPALFQKLGEQKIAEIPKNVWIDVVIPGHGGGIVDRVALGRQSGDLTPRIHGNLVMDVNNWNERWSPAEYVRNFQEKARESDNRLVANQRSQSDVVGLGLTYTPEPSRTIDEAIQGFIQLVIKYRDEVTATLASRFDRGSLVTMFEFPEDVRVPCEQYLLYFVQFLSDIGVKAEAELRHEAGHVLFSVTPANGEEALDNIRRALDVYLELASASEVQISGLEVGDFRVQRLSANLQHLRGQLMLASAALQLKDATIQQQQLTIHHQASLLSGSVVRDGLVGTAVGGEKEEILGGTVAITMLKGKGFEVNLPEIFRRMRQIFAGNDE